MAITWNATAAVIDTGNPQSKIKYLKIRIKKKSRSTYTEIKDDMNNTEASGILPTVMVFTGSGVSSKEIHDGDPVVARIMKSKELYTTIHSWQREYPSVEFVRKETVSDSISRLKQHCTSIIGTIVLKSGDPDKMTALISNVCNESMSLKNIRKDRDLLSALCGQAYSMLRIPVLLVYFIVLALNMALFSNISGKLNESRIEHEAILRTRKAIIETDGRQKALITEFSSIPELKIPYIADLIASTVPDDTRLTNMDIRYTADKGTSITVSGETGRPESIMQMSKSLAENGTFSRIDIEDISVDNRRKGNLKFQFNIVR